MKKNNHIAIFIPSFEGGGAEKMMIVLANEFYSKGKKVDFIVIKKQGVNLSSLNKDINIVNLNKSRLLFSFPGLIWYFRVNNPDVILSAMTDVNILTILACFFSGRKRKTRVVISERSYFSLNILQLSYFKRFFLRFLIKISYPHSNKIIAISKGVAEDLSNVLALPKETVSTIYNPAFNPSIIEKSFLEAEHHWLKNETAPVILAVGRLEAVKNFVLLIRAFSKVLQKIDARLIIAGEGSQRKLLESTIKKLDIIDKVSMPGFVVNPYVYMRRSSVFVLSSNFEGFGNVVVEAMACGLPIISTDCPSGPSEILENGKWGKVIPVGDINSMSEAILSTLMGDVSHCDFMKRVNDFSSAKIADDYLRELGCL